MKARNISAFLLAIVLCLSLCACGRSVSSAREEGAAQNSQPVPAPGAVMYTAADMAYEEYEASGLGMVASNGAAKSDSRKSGDTPENNPEKIIYSGDATIETTEFEKSIAALEEMIVENGGFIESSSVNGSNYYDSSRGYTSKRSASYTLRIPSEKFSSLMGELSTIGNVPYTHTYTENVTAQYYDVQARLTALQAQEKRLLEMLEIAESVEDIITIEDKLSDVRYRIDSQQSSLNNWDRRVAYSSLNLTVKEVQVYTPEKVTRLTYGQELVRTFLDALENAGQFFKDLLLFIVSAVPTLLILAALFFVFRPLLKKLHAKGKESRARRKAAKAARKAAAGQIRAEAADAAVQAEQSEEK